MIDSATRAFVITRANARCEYCHLPQKGYAASFNIDHIVASQHRHDDTEANLAFCCAKCNRKKGPNLAGIDPQSQLVTILFHPRTDDWAEHFSWNGPLIVGITPHGRATVAALDLNNADRVRLRQALFAEGLLGPDAT